LNENFYIVGENVSRKKFEFLRISLIEEVIYSKKVFFIDNDIVKFINTIQTPWASFGKKDIVIRLKVDKSVRRFFVLKKYLPSQKVVYNYENGDIEVEYIVSNYMEIEDLIIKWLPHITIISPRNLKKMVKKSLEKKLRRLIVS
jgi:predicted DNA-binding transcriptional regulator YafY